MRRTVTNDSLVGAMPPSKARNIDSACQARMVSPTLTAPAWSGTHATNFTSLSQSMAFFGVCKNYACHP